jgi:hypothetical protein
MKHSSPLSLSVEEQETLVPFHAPQISQLVGPAAIFSGLVRNSTVLATAIMIFRRFYLSNSVLDFSPRRLAVAVAYLGSKLEDQRVELDLLERATAVIERQVSSGKRETYFVSASDIEAGERELMEGLNYEMRSHHPHAAIRVLAKEMSLFLSEMDDSRDSEGSEDRNPSDSFVSGAAASPRLVCDFSIARRDRSLSTRKLLLLLRMPSSSRTSSLCFHLVRSRLLAWRLLAGMKASLPVMLPVMISWNRA